MPAVIIGLAGGVVCFTSVSIVKAKLGYDDSLDAFGVHGVGGTFGALATGLFSSKAINPAGADGLFYGNPEQLLLQFYGAAATWIVAIVATLVILKGLSLVMKLRVDEEKEIQGLDLSEHGERGYAYQDLATGSPLHLSAFAAMDTLSIPGSVRNVEA